MPSRPVMPAARQPFQAADRIGGSPQGRSNLWAIRGWAPGKLSSSRAVIGSNEETAMSCSREFIQRGRRGRPGLALGPPACGGGRFRGAVRRSGRVDDGGNAQPDRRFRVRTAGPGLRLFDRSRGAARSFGVAMNQSVRQAFFDEYHVVAADLP